MIGIQQGFDVLRVYAIMFHFAGSEQESLPEDECKQRLINSINFNFFTEVSSDENSKLSLRRSSRVR